MSRFNDSGRRPPLLHRRRRATTVAMGIVLITVGLILWLAVPGGFPEGRGVHAVGVVLTLAGMAGVLLPGPARGRQRRWLRTRWISPGLTRPRGEQAVGPGPVGYDEGPEAAERLPGFDFDPPPEAPASGIAGPP